MQLVRPQKSTWLRSSLVVREVWQFLTIGLVDVVFSEQIGSRQAAKARDFKVHGNEFKSLLGADYFIPS